MLEYRVEELADEAGVSVDVLRSYQSKGLLPPPRHVGRLALYGERHLDRLRTIRDLKARGHSLRAIASLLNDPASERRRPTLAEELAGDQERLSLVELAERTRVPPAMLRSLEGSRVLRPLRVRGEPTYTAADVRAVRMLLSLVGSGLPIEEFMEVARVQLEAVDTVAHGAVNLFLRYAREPLATSGVGEKEQAERLVASFRLMLQAVSELIVYNLQRTVLDVLRDEMATRGSGAERAALEREAERRPLDVAGRPA